jgi:uncharacterized nucleotidyltransferase DUF6036
MKKRQLDHVLRAAGDITGDTQFVIIGSQALHGKYPDLPDAILVSAEVDLIAKNKPQTTELLNAIGQESLFHETHGVYADPVDEATACLPDGWQGRLVNLPAGDTNGVRGLCLEPHDLAISKYVAWREKDQAFLRELVRRKLLSKAKLLALVSATRIPEKNREAVRARIERDFKAA